MKNNFFVRVNAIILAICLVVSSVLSIKLYRVYAREQFDGMLLAEEYGDMSTVGDTFEHVDYPDYDADVQNQIEPEPVAEPENNSNDETFSETGDTEPVDNRDEPDPFFYNLTCYDPNLNFGTVYQNDYVDIQRFSIVNTGENPFPLTWDEFDPSTAFELYVAPGADLDTVPGSQTPFYIVADSSLPEGNYSAYYVFYSANDIRQHQRVQVTATMTIKKSEPYITSVEIIPASTSLPVGKSYQFTAKVTGGNKYDESVNWSITGNSSTSTSIKSDGTLSLASNETSPTLAVIATSKQDPRFYDSAIVTIEPVDHIVRVSADPVGAGAVAGGGAVRNGGSMRVSASPNNNYSFAGWYEGSNLISTAPAFDLTNITSDRNVVARFSRTTCYIKTSVNTSDGGTISDSCTIQSGGSVTITAKAKSGYAFKEFVENNKTLSTSSSIQLNNVTSDRNITAVFVRNQYNVYVSVTPQDTGKYEGAGTYDKGKKVVIKQSAYDGYEFAGWIINGQIVSYNAEYVVDNISNDLNITASFRKKETKTYKMVSGITNEGGAIVPSGEYVVAEGGSVTYQIVPNANYTVKTVTVDGKNIGPAGSYTFNKIGMGHTITATFEKVQPAAETKQSTTTNQKAVTTKKQETKKTEYTEKTANEGAIPEQNVVKEESKTEEIEELDEETYIEDTFVPLDESPVVSLDDTTPSNSIIAKYGFDDATVRRLINDNAEMALLKEAYEIGTLQVTVNNSFAQYTQETSQGLYFDNPSLINFEKVVSATLSEDEKVSVLSGNPILFNVSITDNTATVDNNTKKVMQTKIGYKPLCYFDFFIMKSGNGKSEVLNRTGAELLVVLPIPEEYKKSGRSYCILRNHNGTVDILRDLDNDPNTVTFRTDKFSEYSIAYEAINVNRLVLQLIIVILVALVLALICYINLWRYRSKRRRHSR
ncbi:MAG: Ig-like domain-containing protein [Butyrivibrio sp.]|uniref:InlB B-repeat-containing protein n=1 Tax=Butyrivibrio sp. TaxID=28121 RepID=UPI0025C66A01|nr:Ig-like domain-containing protein [Butyrivibrio sp.]MBQ6587856.1 Ig-like domain-containing protein [Butyrivibrio sp.]